jgi:kynurenine formamidase
MNPFKGTQVYELSYVLSTQVPRYWALPPFLHVYLRRPGDVVNEQGVTVASDLVVTAMHVGTHVDAPYHVHSLYEEKGPPPPAGEELPVIIGRGRLLDCRALVSAGRVELGRADLEGLLRGQGASLRKGDVVLIATGWEQRAHDPEAYSGRDALVPGITLEAAQLLAEAGVQAVGADTPLVEASTCGLQVHRFLLRERGILIMENLVLAALADARPSAFVFLALPLRIRGGTGSPIRAVALVGEACQHLERALL